MFGGVQAKSIDKGGCSIGKASGIVSEVRRMFMPFCSCKRNAESWQKITGIKVAMPKDGGNRNSMSKLIFLFFFFVFHSQQSNLSPRQVASLTLPGQVVRIDYGAPSVRGRKIWGGLLPFGKIWGMGANESTKLSFDLPLKIGKQRIEPGTYSLLAVFDEKNWWLIINKKKTDLYCFTPYTKEIQAEEVGRFLVERRQLTSPVEQLSFSFVEKRRKILLLLKWEYQQIEIPIVF